ncbi:MAG: 1-acyl-sn-glycerol-3-phosphate acyltransferase [Actinobacteria bacterium]|nr:1-acyl-sn-glycerol-3-phosphate acyltransferase [Actinomycetota bacterium]
MLRKPLAVIRMGFAYVFVVIATGFLGASAIVLALINPKMPMINRVIRTWGRVALFFGAVKVTVVGADLLDPDGSYMLISNHQSAMDPPIHAAKLPVSVRFLAKKELFKFPIFGRAMRAVGMVETDRRAGIAGHRAINQQVARVMELEKSLIIYPEGTRTRDGDLRTFKKGAFRIAIDNDLPIVPLTLHGAFEAWPPGSRVCWGGPVTMVIHEPIPTHGLATSDIESLLEQTRDIMATTLARLQAEAG